MLVPSAFLRAKDQFDKTRAKRVRPVTDVAVLYVRVVVLGVLRRAVLSFGPKTRSVLCGIVRLALPLSIFFYRARWREELLTTVWWGDVGMIDDTDARALRGQLGPARYGQARAAHRAGPRAVRLHRGGPRSRVSLSLSRPQHPPLSHPSHTLLWSYKPHVSLSPAAVLVVCSVVVGVLLGPTRIR